MGKVNRWLVGTLVVALGLSVVVTGTAQQPRPARDPRSLSARIAAKSGVAEEDVDKVLRELGPEVQRDLASGRSVDLQRLGRLRVVQIPEHRNLVDGRPATIPSRNEVEFLPSQDLVAAANAPGAVPAAVVQPFEYHPFTDRVPSNKVPDFRVPSRNRD
jgi:nucleoid DNA-binding protein